MKRLEDYERNDLGSQPIIIDTSDPLPNFPDISNFTTLTKSDREIVPNIARAHVEQYIFYRQGMKGNAMEKGEKMLGEIHALSYHTEAAVSSSSSPAPTTSVASSSSSSSEEEGSNQLFYVTGIAGAEMYKGVAYNIKLLVDNTGEPLQAHCECPAGRGPTSTCKHIVAVLLCLVKFSKEDILQVQLSCTEQPQTFKRPARSHQGPPVPAEKLGRFKVHDPRPQKYRDWSRQTGEDGLTNYQHHIHNATTNYCA